MRPYDRQRADEARARAEDALRPHAEEVATLWRVTRRRPGEGPVSRITGVAPSTCRRRIIPILRELGSPEALRQWAGAPPSPPPSQSVNLTEPSPPPSDETPIDQVLEYMEAEYERLHANREARRIRTVRVEGQGPVGVLLMGDPHVDDPGCDIGQLRRDLAAVAGTPACWALCVGDVTNNWVGRLARLYAHQSTTQERGVRLARWMLSQAPYLGLVHGNHDNWGDGGWLLLKYLTREADIVVRARHDLRVALQWPGGESIHIHARHDFPGHSWFNPTHGLDKRSLLDPWPDLLVCGHKHVSHATTGPKLEGWGWRTAVRVAGYKRHDTYADEKGFVPREHEPSALVVLDPEARTADRIRVYWDVAAGCAEVARLRGQA